MVVESNIENLEYNIKLVKDKTIPARLLSTLNKIQEESEHLKQVLNLLILITPCMKENFFTEEERIPVEVMPKNFQDLLKLNNIPERICIQATVIVMNVISRLLRRIERQLASIRKGKSSTDESQLRISGSQLSTLVRTFIPAAIRANPDDIFYKEATNPVWVELSKHYSTYVIASITTRTALVIP